MAQKTQMITREQVIALAQQMPLDKLIRWYEYGVFIQSHPLFVPENDHEVDDNAELQAEIAQWEAASDEDWDMIDQNLAKAE